MKSFKQQHSLEDRIKESARILEKYPDRIPIVIEQHGEKLPTVDKKKFLVPSELTVVNFIHIIRKRTKLNPEDGIYLFCGNQLLSGAKQVGACYKDYKDADGFLYITYSGENTFG